MNVKTIRKWINLGISVVKIRMFSPDCEKDNIALLDTSINTDNRGDEIIMYYCRKALEEIFCSDNYIKVPTHSCPESRTVAEMKRCRDKIICGTNILSCALEHTALWKLSNKLDAYAGCTAMGAGWGFYSDKTSLFTQIFYRNILSRSRLHAVRDRYTLEKLKEIGVANVLYTGCPTMWGLTPELCKEIPKEKADKVVFTLTSYDPNETDRTMIEILCRNYKKVYAWPQGNDDKKYIQSLLHGYSNVILLEESLDAYRKILKNESIDYVGTRLHGGVMALNMKKRSIIIAVDNRAIEIGKDTKLPVLTRDEVTNKLEGMISSSWDTVISMPFENIERWKKQFLQS